MDTDLASSEESLEASSAQVERCRAAVADAETLVVEGGQRLEDARLNIAGLEAEARSWAQRVDELAHRREQLQARAGSARERIEAAERGALEALQQLRQARLQAQGARAQFEISAAQRDRALSDSHDPLQALGELERQRAELEASVQSAVAQAEAWRHDLTFQTEQVARLQAEVAEVPKEALETSGPTVPEDPARAAAEISRTERRLNDLGPINELAPRQLAEILERTEGLRAAHDDCLQARADLEDVLGRLQAMSSRRFESTLHDVAAEFSAAWEELFGGGRAALISTPGDAGGTGGVEMQIQPAGKRVLSMQLLSGGERALTALALVLAMQKVSPSPFYVFDEVDAALDEANIVHFAELLERRSESSQFLVVTHSLTTMSKASVLYGVIQDGGGSSRILSARLTSDGHAIEADDGVELETVASGG